MSSTTSGDSLLRTIVVVGDLFAGGVKAQGCFGDIAEEVLCADDAVTGLHLVERTSPELVIVSEQTCGDEALTLVEKIGVSVQNVPVVVVSADPCFRRAVRFGRAGALDYVDSPPDAASLTRLLRKRRPIPAASEPSDCYFCSECPPGVPIVGHSEGLVRMLKTIRLVAVSGCNPILIVGETGSGKELAAKAAHAWCSRDNDMMVAINCATLTANLLESELFGHVKGAFTGADREKIGLLELAGNGSVFLDEISEMPPGLQAKLLRFLQDKTFRRVGGTKDIACGATIIASSNRDLLKESRNGRFRKDLYYRLAVFPIEVPPLRHKQRRRDIPLLAGYFVQNPRIRTGRVIHGLAGSAQERLMSHDWPGNVRELRNVMDRAVLLETADEITPENLMFESSPQQPGDRDAQRTRPVDFSLETAEREFIMRALKETEWQRTRAAALLGITRSTLHAKIKRYRIEAPGAKLPGGPCDSSDTSSESLVESVT